MFNVGDKIVYPMHGAGVIDSIEEKNILGEKQSYYILKMPGEVKVMVPTAKAEEIGVRNIIDKSSADKVIGVLEQDETVMDKNWNKRYRDNMDKMKSGDIYEIADVVRNLSFKQKEKGLSTGEKKMLNNAKQILVSELVLAEHATQEEVEQLVENKIDSFIEHSDGSKEPANTFFYGVLNDSSIIENEFDKYMGKGAWRDLDTFISNLHNTNISKEQFDMVFKEAQGMIIEFANARMQEKYKEAVARNGQSVPTIANKINMINEMTGIELEQEQFKEQIIDKNNVVQFPEGYSINEYGEIIRPARREIQEQVQESIDVQQTESKLTLKQKVAQFLQKNNLFMNLSFVDKFVHKQLDIFPARTEIVRQTNAGIASRTRKNFINQLTNFGAYRNLPPIQRMSNPEKIAQMRRKMEQKEQNNDDSERG